MAVAVVIFGVVLTALSLGGLAGWVEMKLYDWFNSSEDRTIALQLGHFSRTRQPTASQPVQIDIVITRRNHSWGWPAR